MCWGYTAFTRFVETVRAVRTPYVRMYVRAYAPYLWMFFGVRIADITAETALAEGSAVNRIAVESDEKHTQKVTFID